MFFYKIKNNLPQCNKLQITEIFNTFGFQFRVWFRNRETIEQRKCWRNLYLFLRFSFLLRLLATLVKDDDEGALA